MKLNAAETNQCPATSSSWQVRPSKTPVQSQWVGKGPTFLQTMTDQQTRSANAERTQKWHKTIPHNKTGVIIRAG